MRLQSLNIARGTEPFIQRWLAGLSFVLIVTGIVGYLKLGQVVYYWDESFIVYDAWRLYLGQIPNSDYVSGYMGAQSLLLAVVFDLFGATFDAYHASMFVYWLIYVAAVFVVARQLASQLSAVFASLLAALGYLQWWYLNPGLSVEILAVLALGSLLLWQRNRQRRFLVLAGLLCGAALSFKQSGLFIGVAALNVITILHLLQAPSRLWHRLAIGFLPVVAFVGYVILRLSGQSVAPTLNYVVLVPWLFIALVLIALTFRTGSRDHGLFPYLADCLGFGGAALAAVAPLVMWYTLNGLAPFALIKETFVRVPALVDRGVAPLGAPDLEMLVMIGASLLPLYLGWLLRRRVAIVASIVVLVMAVLVGFYGARDFAGFIDGIYERLWRGFIWWTILVTPFVLMAVVLPTQVGRLGLIHHETERLCIPIVFGGTFLAIAFPWPTHMYVVAIVALMAVALASAISTTRSRNGTAGPKRVSKWLGIALCCALVAMLFDYQLRIQRPLYPIEVDQPRLHGWVAQNEAPYIELTQAIQRLPEGETVFAYPNLAFSMFLAGRAPQTKYGNFLGGEPEFDSLVREIEDMKVDWVIVSPNDYGSLFYLQYGLAQRGLSQALAPQYEKAFTLSEWDFYRRVRDR